MNEGTITVSLTLAQRELILDGLASLVKLFNLLPIYMSPDDEEMCAELEDLLGPIPAE